MGGVAIPRSPRCVRAWGTGDNTFHRVTSWRAVWILYQAGSSSQIYPMPPRTSRTRPAPNQQTARGKVCMQTKHEATLTAAVFSLCHPANISAVLLVIDLVTGGDVLPGILASLPNGGRLPSLAVVRRHTQTPVHNDFHINNIIIWV